MLSKSHIQYRVVFFLQVLQFAILIILESMFFFLYFIFLSIKVVNSSVKSSSIPTSAKCKLDRKLHANLPDTPIDLTSASKYFQMLPDPPGAKQSALRLCKSIHRCS
jgi:hypothetical protein